MSWGKPKNEPPFYRLEDFAPTELLMLDEPPVGYPNKESAAESSDRLLRENAVGWVEHFAMHGTDKEADGIYRFLCRVKGRMERERGFSKK